MVETTVFGIFAENVQTVLDRYETKSNNTMNEVYNNILPQAAVPRFAVLMKLHYTPL